MPAIIAVSYRWSGQLLCCIYLGCFWVVTKDHLTSLLIHSLCDGYKQTVCKYEISTWVD